VTSGWRSVTIPLRSYTLAVVTLWYKAPELIVGGLYESSIEMWNVGYILYEMMTYSPFFSEDGQLDEIMGILAVVGTLSEDDCP
jgi:serine/threonine protein kinase